MPPRPCRRLTRYPAICDPTSDCGSAIAGQCIELAGDTAQALEEALADAGAGAVDAEDAGGLRDQVLDVGARTGLAHAHDGRGELQAGDLADVTARARVVGIRGADRRHRLPPPPHELAAPF